MTDSELERNFDNLLLQYLTSKCGKLSDDICNNTPGRFREYLQYALSGYQDDVAINIFPNQSSKNDTIAIEEIDFSSICEHHLIPFCGTISIQYIPNASIIGFGDVLKIVKHCSKKLQLQEKLTNDIANLFDKHLLPKELIVTIAAKHECMRVMNLGEKLPTITTITERKNL